MEINKEKGLKHWNMVLEKAKAEDDTVKLLFGVDYSYKRMIKTASKHIEELNKLK